MKLSEEPAQHCYKNQQTLVDSLDFAIQTNTVESILEFNQTYFSTEGSGAMPHTLQLVKLFPL